MAAYFDWTNDDHLALLPPQYRTGEALARIAPLVEVEVIDLYTVQESPSRYRTSTVSVLLDSTANGRYVALRSYTPDAADCTDDAFLLAMRRTVARVLTWRLDQERLSPFDASVSGQSGKGSSRSFRLDARDTLPPNWNVFLRAFDERPPLIAV